MHHSMHRRLFASFFRVSGAMGMGLSLTLAGSALAQDYRLEGGSIGVEQVARGAEAYYDNCSGCHGEDLKSLVSTAPDLTGSVFKYGWAKKDVGSKFDVISTTMPSGAGGSLDAQTYADIVAYILSFNGVAPSQDADLPPDSAALHAITILPN